MHYIIYHPVKQRVLIQNFVVFLVCSFVSQMHKISRDNMIRRDVESKHIKECMKK